jgi:hypothetical protein
MNHMVNSLVLARKLTARSSECWDEVVLILLLLLLGEIFAIAAA